LQTTPAIKDVLTRVADEANRAWAYRGFGLFVAWCIAVGAVLMAVVWPDKFTSRAQVYVNTDTLLRPLLKGLTVDNNAEQQVAIVQKTLLTDVNLTKVLLQSDEDLKVASRADLASAIEGLRSQIRIDGVGNQLFSISFDGSAPERARQVVQSLLSIFIESNLGISRTDMQTARDFLDQQIATYQEQMDAAGKKLAEYRADHVNVLGQTDFSARLAAARSGLQDANIELQGAQEVRRSLKSRLDDTDAFVGTDAPPAQVIIGDSLIVSAIDRINTLRAQLQALRLRYTEDHPDVIAARDELAALVRQYSSEDKKLAGPASPPPPPRLTTAQSEQPAQPTALAPQMSASSSAATQQSPTSVVQPSATPSLTPGHSSAPTHGAAAGQSPTAPNPEYAEIKAMLLKAELAILDAEQKVARQQATLASLEAEAKNAPPIEAEYAELTRQFDSAKKNYEDLLPRRESARISQAVDTTVDVVQFRVVDPPTVPAKASGPNRNIILLLGTLLALGGGAFAAFARGTIAGAVTSARDLAASYGLPVIATIGGPSATIQRMRLSFQIMSLTVSALGLAVAMFVVGYLLPPLEHYRFKIYEVASQTLHL
jgi:uncharacterized protein involved in exopolysaccharide biosynthesis